MPLISAITGCGILIISCINSEHKLNRSLKKASPLSLPFLAAVISFRSCPAENTFPFAANTTTFIDLSKETLLSSSINKPINFFDKAFLLTKSFIVKRMTP